MRVVSESTITVDLIGSVVDVGELAKLAVKFGMAADISRVYDEEMGTHTQLVMHSGSAEFVTTEIANLLLLTSYAQSRSINAVLELVIRHLRDRHAPLDKPIQDVMEIGGGPEHEGHDDG